MPTELLEPVEAPEYVERPAMLFEAGSYPQRGIDVTEDDLDRIIAGTTEAPVQIGHKEPSFTLGTVRDLVRKGKELWGTLRLHPEANSLVERNGVRSLSVAIPRSKDRLMEVSFTGTPLVRSAAVFSEDAVVFCVGDTPREETAEADEAAEFAEKGKERSKSGSEGHWVTIEGTHVHITGGKIDNPTIAAAVAKHGLSKESHETLKAAHEAGKVTTDEHLYKTIAHAKREVAAGKTEKEAVQSGLEKHAKGTPTPEPAKPAPVPIEKAFEHTKPVRNALLTKLTVFPNRDGYFNAATKSEQEDLVKGGYATKEVHTNGTSYHPTEKAIQAKADLEAIGQRLHEGIPLAERPKQLANAKVDGAETYHGYKKPTTREFITGQHNGDEWHSDKFFAMKGAAPPNVPQKFTPNFSRVMPDNIGSEITPETFHASAGSDSPDDHYIKMSNGQKIKAKYHDLMQKHYPGATFHETDSKSGTIAVKHNGEHVGIIMPISGEYGEHVYYKSAKFSFDEPTTQRAQFSRATKGQTPMKDLFKSLIDKLRGVNALDETEAAEFAQAIDAQPDPPASIAPAEFSRLQDELNRLKTERVAEAALTWADGVIREGRALPTEKDAMLAAFCDAADRDSKESAPVTFSAGGQEVQASRVDLLKRLYAQRQPHLYFSESVREEDFKDAAALFNKMQTEHAGAEKPYDDKRRSELLALTPLGQAILNEKRGN